MKEEMKEKLIGYITSPAREVYTQKSIASKLENSVLRTIAESGINNMTSYFEKEDELFKKAISYFYKELTDSEIVELSGELRKAAEKML